MEEARSDTPLFRSSSFKPLKAAGLALIFGMVGALLGSILVSPDWKLAVTYIGITAYIAAVLVNPVLGFLLWIATSPFGRFFYLNISFGHGIPDLSLDRLSAAFILALLMAQLAIRKRHLAGLTRVDLFIVLFLIGTGFSLPQAIVGPKATAQAYFDSQIVPLVVYFLAKNLIYTKDTINAAVTTLLFIGAYMAFLVIREQVTGQILFYPEGRTIIYTAHIRRVVGLLGNPAFFAMILGMILPFNFRALLEASKKSSRMLHAGLLSGTFVALYLCYNRAGWLGTLLALLVMAWLYPRFRRWFVLLLLIGAILLAAFWSEVNQSYVITERVTAQAPIEYRLNAINVALRMISDSPILGRGYGNFGHLYKKYASDWTQQRVMPAPHNTYINILVSSGLAGFIPYIAIFLAIFHQGFSLWRKGHYNRAIDRTLLACMIGSVVVYTLTIFFSDIVASPYVTSLFFFIVGSVLGSQERASRWGDPKGWLQL